MLDRLDAALRFQQEALNLRAQRQEILAANIANADTPGYQARDIDFASELKKVMVRGRDAWTGRNRRRRVNVDFLSPYSRPGGLFSRSGSALPRTRSAFFGW